MRMCACSRCTYDHAVVTSTCVSVKQDVLSKLSLAESKLSQLSKRQDMLTAQHHLELEKVRRSYYTGDSTFTSNCCNYCRLLTV